MIKRVETLVLSGGGLKGLSYCGVFRYLEEIRKRKKDVSIDIKEIISVSAGGLFGLCYILGYTYVELRNNILQQKLKDFQSGKLSHFLEGFGIDTGENLVRWIENMIINKGHDPLITFNELYKISGIHFKVVTTNLTTYLPFLFDHVNTPDMSIVESLRLSLTIPFAFTMKKYKNDIHLDGALTVNYPIDYASDINKTLGFYFWDKDKIGLCESKTMNQTNEHENETLNLSKYITDIFTCLSLAIDRHRIVNYHTNTVFISLSDVNILNFKLTKKQRMDIIRHGYEYTKQFFENIESQ